MLDVNALLLDRSLFFIPSDPYPIGYMYKWSFVLVRCTTSRMERV